MISDWKKGDVIYALVPYKNNDFIDYRIEEVSLIVAEKVTNYLGTHMKVKFKYTDYMGLRKRVENQIYVDYWNRSYLEAYKDYTGFEDHRYYKLWYSDNKQRLIDLYKELFRNWLHSTENKIEELNVCRDVYADRLLTCNIQEYKYEQKV